MPDYDNEDESTGSGLTNWQALLRGMGGNQESPPLPQIPGVPYAKAVASDSWNALKSAFGGQQVPSQSGNIPMTATSGDLAKAAFQRAEPDDPYNNPSPASVPGPVPQGGGSNIFQKLHGAAVANNPAESDDSDELEASDAANLPASGPEDRTDEIAKINARVKAATGGAVAPEMQRTSASQESEADDANSTAPKDKAGMPKTLDIQGKELGTVENLLKAQKAANDARFTSQMLKAGNLLSAGIARVSPSKAADKVFDDMEKHADQPVKDFEQAVKQQDTDPNSPASQAFRQYAKSLGVNIEGDFTAAQGKTLLPMIWKGFEAQENRDARHENLEMQLKSLEQRSKEHNDMMRALRQQQDYLKAEKTNNQTEKDYEAQLERMKSGRGSIGDPRKKVQQVEGAEAVIRDYMGNLNAVPENLKNEFMAAYNNITTGGQGTDMKFQKLMAKTGINSAAKFWQYIANDPVAAQQGGFIQMFLDSARNQKNTAQAQVDEEEMKHLKGWTDRLRPGYVSGQASMKQSWMPGDVERYKPGMFKERAALPEDAKDQLYIFFKNHPDASQEEALNVLRKAGLISTKQ